MVAHNRGKPATFFQHFMKRRKPKYIMIMTNLEGKEGRGRQREKMQFGMMARRTSVSDINGSK